MQMCLWTTEYALCLQNCVSF